MKIIREKKKNGENFSLLLRGAVFTEVRCSLNIRAKKISERDQGAAANTTSNGRTR